jgi:hypothetical protein
MRADSAVVLYILDKLYNYANLFNNKAAQTLLSLKNLDYAISIIDRKEPSYRLLYLLLAYKLEVLRKYIKNAL